MHFGKGVINPWRVISDYEYFVFEEGEGALIIEGIDYPCPEKSFIIIPSGKRHISYANSDSVLLHWGHFDWVPTETELDPMTFMEPAIPDPAHFRQAPAFLPEKVFHGPIHDPQVFVLLRQFALRIKSEDNFERLLTTVTAAELFLRLLSPKEHTRHAVEKDSYTAAENLRLQLTKIAHEPINTTLPLEQLLSTGGFSYSRQERLFKEVFGVTPHQYITLLRVERIKQLLDDNTSTISDIADNMGFNDLAYFSRFVSKHLGASPRSLRS